MDMYVQAVLLKYTEVLHHENSEIRVQLIFFQVITNFSLIWINQVLK